MAIALEHGSVLVTKDQDFRNMVLLRGSPPPVVWVRVGNTRHQALLIWFEPLIGLIVELIGSGNDLMELR